MSKRKGPAVVGVPEITPVAGFKKSPGGRKLPLTRLYV